MKGREEGLEKTSSENPSNGKTWCEKEHTATEEAIHSTTPPLSVFVSLDVQEAVDYIASHFHAYTHLVQPSRMKTVVLVVVEVNQS